MNVDIKFTHEQHELLLARLGNDEAIRTWLEESLTRAFDELHAGKAHHNARNLFATV